MPLTKPTVLPEWAMDDVPDPISGQYNVVNPPPEKKLLGWDYLEKPNRQYWNWFQRTVSDWIAYLNENLDFDTDQFVSTWQGLDAVSINTNNCFYSKQGDKCFFTIHIIWTGNTDLNINGIKLTNLPFKAKNLSGLLQSVHVSRGVGPTLPNGKVLSALVNQNSFTMDLWGDDVVAGTGAIVKDTIGSGQLIISGFYFIEPTV